MQDTLWECISRLAPLNPDFVSVTYGAGGSTRERTHETVVKIQNEKKISTAAHLTCVGASKQEIDDIARRYWDSGIRHIVALRGDFPEGSECQWPQSDGYDYASDLVVGLKKIADFEISVAAYPETHPQAPSRQFDIDNLKRKIDAGASRAITQYFFDTEAFLRFRDSVTAAGIFVPLIPGIMPVTNFKAMAEFSKRCGTKVPQWIADQFFGLEEDHDTRRLIAAVIAAEQCRYLVAEDLKNFHFYTLNRADLVFAICHLLGVRPHDRTITKEIES